MALLYWRQNQNCFTDLEQIMHTEDYVLPETEISHDAKGKQASRQLEIAVAAILCEMAHADDALDSSELERIVRMMEHEFHLTDEESEEIREVAENLIQDKSKIEEFIDRINHQFSLEQKQKIYDMACAVAQSDGKIDDYEQFFATYLCARLGLK